MASDDNARTKLPSSPSLVESDRRLDRSVLIHFFLIFCTSFVVGLLVIHSSAIYAQFLNTRNKQQDSHMTSSVSDEIQQLLQYDSHVSVPHHSDAIGNRSNTTTTSNDTRQTVRQQSTK
ncbi:uncharacterized protein LOC134195745 [Corticium candelabrum]|uniref:uncharacterized protein LOC134195745 n=1 Tax=Corticium candelabrum TaxID=121492 RepID=UPI002E2702A1|nr:uncharacterized protein LOC134195745 [Corticium candelabrum]